MYILRYRVGRDDTKERGNVDDPSYDSIGIDGDDKIIVNVIAHFVAIAAADADVGMAVVVEDGIAGDFVGDFVVPVVGDILDTDDNDDDE